MNLHCLISGGFITFIFLLEERKWKKSAISVNQSNFTYNAATERIIIKPEDYQNLQVKNFSF